MGLAEGVAAGNQGDRFDVIHGHPAEGFADVESGGERIGIALGAFGVHIDEAHLNGAEGIIELSRLLVAVAGAPGMLRTPIDVVLGLPGIFAAGAEAEGLAAHRLEGDVTGKDHEVGPGDAAAVLLLDRPKQAARLIEAGIVGPAIFRRETLSPSAGAAAA